MADAPKVRPNIAAKERGPGPARYALPGTVGTGPVDATAKKSPAFSLSSKLGTSLGGKTAGPGPAYKVEAGIVKSGKDGTPKYSMAGRPKDIKLHRGPGPGAYSPEKVKVDKGKSAPQYTMRARTTTRKSDSTPASNAYGLKSSVGVAPKYSMTGRSMLGGFDQDLAKAPGPGKYGKTNPDAYKKKNPAFTMAGRTKVPQDATKKPGPGAHKVPDATVTSRSKKAPSFSMGQRHSDYLTPLIVDVMD